MQNIKQDIWLYMYSKHGSISFRIFIFPKMLIVLYVSYSTYEYEYEHV
jgi:hypothetical protein